MCPQNPTILIPFQCCPGPLWVIASLQCCFSSSRSQTGDLQSPVQARPRPLENLPCFLQKCGSSSSVDICSSQDAETCRSTLTSPAGEEIRVFHFQRLHRDAQELLWALSALQRQRGAKALLHHFLRLLILTYAFICTSRPLLLCSAGKKSNTGLCLLWELLHFEGQGDGEKQLSWGRAAPCSLSVVPIFWRAHTPSLSYVLKMSLD